MSGGHYALCPCAKNDLIRDSQSEQCIVVTSLAEFPRQPIRIVQAGISKWLKKIEIKCVVGYKNASEIE